MSPPSIYVSPNGYTSLINISSLLTPFLDLSFSPSPLHPYHLTLLTKSESRLLSSQSLPSPFSSTTSLSDLIPVGLGSHQGGTFLVVLFPSANKARRKVGLMDKDFHVSITTPVGMSSEELEHGISTLDKHPLSIPSTSPKLLDCLILHHFSRGGVFEASNVAEGWIIRDPASYKPFIRLGDACLKLEQYKTAMLSFGRAFDLSSSTTGEGEVQEYALKGILKCSAWTEWGIAMRSEERRDLEGREEGVRRELVKSWSGELKERVLERLEKEEGWRPGLQIASREAVFVPVGRGDKPGPMRLHQMQRFFRWIVPFHLAISSEPRDELDIEALAQLGIQHIVTLTSERRLPADWFRNTSMKNTYLPMDDRTAPSQEQIEVFIRLATSDETTRVRSHAVTRTNADFVFFFRRPLLVHCAGGKGRAGTMIASYLIAYGFARAQPPWSYPTMGFRQALSILRQIRPHSVESNCQEDRLRSFATNISKRGSVLPPEVLEPVDALPTIEGIVDRSTDLVVLVGLPGSGKSWFRKALVARDPSWKFVSGDEDGGTSIVHRAASQHRRGKLIIDQVNPSLSHRKTLLSLAQNASAPIAVFFDVPTSVCLSRAQRRTDHPSLPPGSRVIAAIKQFEKTIVRPRLSEGFRGIGTVTSFESSRALVLRLSPPLTLFKFPRTPHLINLGSATSDDIIRPLADFTPRQRNLNCVISEKIDGANLAFSLDEDRRILVQNRSHYVDEGSHLQFKKLGRYLEMHREELNKVLGEDEDFPQRWIFVKYTHLPDVFLAFDLYDRATLQFVSRRTLENRLRETSIHLTPILHSGEQLQESEMLEMIQQNSAFSMERMEGIYIKLEDEDKVVERGKIVREDFIAGNEHWSKGMISFNEIDGWK
ncbi:hypothetical protein P7C70_g7661, partial [Phenoliferia sp. Uapishka_3]